MTSDSQQMRDDWESRAKAEALFAIDSEVHHESLESFYARGNELVPVFIDPVLTHFTVDPTDLTVLEIGCGMGRLFPCLKKYFKAIIGIDISPTMIRKGSESCPVQATWIHGDGDSLKGIESDSVDYVLSFEVFQHVSSEAVIVSYFNEISRVLRPGCIFQVQMRKGSDTKRQAFIRRMPPSVRDFVFQALRFMKRIGFKQFGHIPMTGKSDTWIGVEIPPERGMEIASRAGFTDLMTFEDTIHLEGMGYWMAGRLP